MNVRGTAIQGGLALAGLLAAYGAWQREPEATSSEVIVMDLKKTDLERIRFEETPAAEGAEARWVELVRGPGEGVALRLSASAAAKRPERELRGNEQAQQLWEAFAPLTATRALGTLDGEKLKELGLGEPKKKLVVQGRGRSRTYLVGTPPAGATLPYVKDEKDGKVYVLGKNLVSELESAPVRLVDRNLHSFKPNEFEQVILKANGKERRFLHKNADNPTGGALVAAEMPDKPDEMAKNWHDRVWRLIPMDALGKGEVPPEGNPQVGLRIEYTGRNQKSLGWIEIGQLEAPENNDPHQSVSGGDRTVLYARTEHTAGWVKLHGAPNLVPEGQSLAAATP